MTRSFLKSLFCLVITFCCALDIKAQLNIDSLKQLISKSEGRELIDLKNQLARYFMGNNFKSAIYEAKEANYLSRKHNYVNGEIESLDIIGSSYYYSGVQDSAVVFLEEAMNLAMDETSKDKILRVGLNLALAQRRSNQVYQAIKTYSGLLEYDKDIVDYKARVGIFINLASLRGQINEQDSSKELLLRAIEVSESKNDSTALQSIYMQLGTLEFGRSNYAIAQQYFFKCLGFIDYTDVTAPYLHMYLGRCYSAMEDYNEALKSFDRALSFTIETDKERKTTILTYKAIAFFKANRFNEATELIDLVYDDAVKLGHLYLIADLLEIKYKISEINGDYKSAHLDFLYLSSIRDSIESKANAEEFRRLTIEYDFEKLKARSETEQKMVEVQLTNRTRMVVLVSIIVLLLLMVLFLNRSKYKTKLKAFRTSQELLKKEMQITSLKLSQSQDLVELFEKEIQDNQYVNDSKKRLLQLLDSSSINAIDWAAIKIAIDDAYPDLNKKLESFDLTFNDQRLVWLLNLKLSNKEIAQVLGITDKSVIKAKSRLSQRMNLSGPKELEKVIINL